MKEQAAREITGKNTHEQCTKARVFGNTVLVGTV